MDVFGTHCDVTKGLATSPKYLPTHLSQINGPLTGAGTSLSPPSTPNNRAPVSAEGCKHRANSAAFPDAWRRWRLLGVSVTHLTRNATTERIPITEPRAASSRVHTWLSADIYARTDSFSGAAPRHPKSARHRVLALLQPFPRFSPEPREPHVCAALASKAFQKKSGGGTVRAKWPHERAGKVCGDGA